jgi:DNA-binding IclR family transcriptional regulator
MHRPGGTHGPGHCPSRGKLFLSLKPEEPLNRLIGSLNLEQKTENTLTTRKSLEKALEKIRKKQVGTDNQEFIEGMVCVAVPIYDRRKRLFATLSIHAPSSRMTLEEISRHVPRLQKASHDLSLISDPDYN